MLGIGFYVDDCKKLEALANIPGSGVIEQVTKKGAGGGKRVTLLDPEGHLIEIRCDMESADDLTLQPPTPLNYAKEKTRPLNSMQRQYDHHEPSQIWRLGHVFVSVKNITRTIKWYQDKLGFIVSDFQFLPGDGKPFVAFMRCDLGEEPTDHHTLAIASIIVPGYDHAAFEVQVMLFLCRRLCFGRLCRVFYWLNNLSYFLLVMG